ncbi:TRAP transporter large permease subunit [Bradyrhizobium sp. U87765 SZCCT0131]|uniref:TRAP transporter large permease n=1 Tax=unclassified Bradyrhizobium TaxID=2631580 RepID=UPI001BA685EC|nr:TRAP transporter large permease subunit [Bradyrhizobium sp. U87765 SZCCT0131]MBR1262044.1 TRAP transporter large permease subunit [Bradyrhizobium sp. U87765 SZCCT0134]MBR1306103.1 TRAP transporter large permease subunit [Bradyrhizobium sp. U87765 SZCCT0110]MBR1317826.1 TRAP transporter large permease subunit [Bradyrhizobium sp. U87765 SZCCT0109]MBR1351528.1 TRAP transporter large permease subunit [Bradyrhizobium sp. U87765 SZCCT0048]
MSHADRADDLVTSHPTDATAPPRAPAAIRAIDTAAEALVVAALLGELALVLANVVARAGFHHSFLWADELARFALSVLAFVGGAVAYRRHDHASVRVVLDHLPPAGSRVLLALADIVVLFVCGLTGIASIEFLASSWSELTPILQWPAALIGAPLPLGMALLALHALLNLRRDHGALALWVGAAFLGVLALAALTRDVWLPLLGDDAAIMVALALFFAAILAGVPVGFVLLLATATYLWGTGTATMVVLPQTMVNGTGNFILLAVPFFILTGLVMERGGISERLVRFIRLLVGHMQGGLLQVTVASMYAVSGLSGSKPADVAAVGTVMRDQLREHHGAPEGAAVLAASAVMGETVPPSIAMLIVGSITNVSVGAMFVGGLVPAAVMALCLMVMIWLRARASGAPRLPRAPAAAIGRASLDAVLPLLMPGTLLIGILAGIATPTEIAALAVVYGVALSALVYREMTLRRFLRIVADTAALTGVLLFIFAAASSFSWTLTVAYLPQRLVALLQSVGGSTTVFMLGSVVLLIVVGVLLEGLPSLNVLAPLLLPIAGKLGISELHYALVLIIAMGIGGFMPFAGVGFYVCCAVMRCNIEAASRAMLPYLVVLIAGLLIVAFVPWFTLFLPAWFGFHG